MAKVYDNATDLITFARSSSGTALRRVGYGPELVVDGSGNWVGDFDVAADLDGWTGTSGATTYAYSSGSLKVTTTASGAGTYQDITTVAGKVYKVEWDYTAGTATSISFRVSNGASYSGDLVSENISAGIGQSAIFTATGTSSRVYLRNGVTGTSYWDNISVKEVIFDRPTDDLVLFNHPDDIPRIEYAADGSLKGLLIEEERTNLVTTSAQGIYGNSPGSTQQTTGPDGSTGGYVPVPDGTSDRFQYSIGAGDFANGTKLTVSWFAKRLTGAPSSYVGELDLRSHVGVSVGAAYEVGASAGGWTRYAATVTVTDNSAQQLVRMYVGGVVAQGAADMAYFGFQLEAGSFATSYIPTAGSTVTRSPDIASIPVSAFGYNQDAGTWLMEWDTADTGNVQAKYVLSSGGNARVMYNNAGSTTFYSYDGSTPLPTYTNPTAITFDGSHIKAAYAEDDGGSSVAHTGVLGTGSGASDLLPNYNPTYGWSIGNLINAAKFLNGHIKSLSYFPRRLTDAQLQELTS